MPERVRSYLAVVLAIFRRDLGRLLHNPVALVLVAGACVLPSAYGWYVTRANWDPYQNAQGIVVAVANQDRGATTALTGHLDVGAQVEKDLRQNTQLGWRFYDTAQEAVASVESGESFAAIVIPEGFSADLAGILAGDRDHATLDYYVNEKISAAAPNFTNAGVQAVQEQVDHSFARSVLGTALDRGDAAGTDAQAKATAAQGALAEGVRQADAALEDTREALAEAGPAIDSAGASVDEAARALRDLQEALPQLTADAQKGRELLDQAGQASTTAAGSLEGRLGSLGARLGSASASAQQGLGSASRSVATASADARTALGDAQGALAQSRGITSALLSASQAATDPAQRQALQQAATALASAQTDLEGTLTALGANVEALDRSLEGGDALADTLAQQAGTAGSQLTSDAATLRDRLSPSLTGALASSGEALGMVSGLAVALEPSVAQALASLEGLSTALDQAHEALGSADQLAATAQQDLTTTLADIQAIQGSTALQGLDRLLQLSPQGTASFLSAPVELKTVDVFPVRDYGSGVCPFFTNVGLWVAGFIFLALFKLRVDPDGLPPFTAGQAYWGRWLLLVCLGLFPPLIACVGDLLLGIQCEHPAAFVLVGVVAEFVYLNLIYGLAQAFRYVGKALAALWLFVQIPGSAGLYPIQMLPAFFQDLHPWLPFTYSIDAMREAIGGFYGLHYLQDLLVLVLLFVPGGLFLGLFVGHRSGNLTLLLDREAAGSGLFVGESGLSRLRYRPSTLLKALLRSPDYAGRLERQAAWFAEHYDLLRKVGVGAVALQLVALAAVIALVHASVNDKLLMMAWLVLVAVASDTYLIVIAYLRQSLPDKVAMLRLPREDLLTRVTRDLGAHAGLAAPAGDGPDAAPAGEKDGGALAAPAGSGSQGLEAGRSFSPAAGSGAGGADAPDAAPAGERDGGRREAAGEKDGAHREPAGEKDGGEAR